ncbi:MAG: type II toxin-antitoxin system RelE/ParE family toxin [Candidatus Omnitrophota bacterium]|nr:MAG: type II toxin-antitoxin system RelE/ParE family toxin [Candidatus Omnitrophota bacterium]
MKILKNKWFAKFARKENIPDARLLHTVMEIEAGKIDADYGGGVIKQRIARSHEGKSGGYRSVILYRQGTRAFFVYGFSKSAHDNISESEIREFKALAKITLALSDIDLERLIEAGVYQEVKSDAEK